MDFVCNIWIAKIGTAMTHTIADMRPHQITFKPNLYHLLNEVMSSARCEHLRATALPSLLSSTASANTPFCRHSGQLAPSEICIRISFRGPHGCTIPAAWMTHSAQNLQRTGNPHLMQPCYHTITETVIVHI